MTPEELSQLLPEFQKLKSVSKKFDFWLHKLKKSYSFYASATSFYNNIDFIPNPFFEYSEFKIIPSQKEVEEYNRRLLQEYTEYLDSPSKKRGFRNINLDKLTNELENSLETKKNKREFIQLRINEINEVFSFYNRLETKNHLDERVNAFKQSFQTLYVDDEELDLSKSYYDINTLIAIHDGIVKAKYLKFLNTKLSELDTTLNNSKEKVTKPKSTEISIRQQMQILHYLGALHIIEQQGTVDKKSTFLSLLLNKSKQNIRKDYNENIRNLTNSNLKPERKKILKELELVKKLFLETGNNTIVKKIDKDIKTLTEQQSK